MPVICRRWISCRHYLRSKYKPKRSIFIGPFHEHFDYSADIYYLSIEGRSSVMKESDRIVAVSRFVYNMIGAKMWVHEGVKVECKRKPMYDVGVVISPAVFQDYDYRKGIIEEVAKRKGVDLYAKVLTELYNRGLKIIVNKVGTRLGFPHTAVGDPEIVYGRARLLLFLSRSEGFGLPVAEAMSCGTPVVYLDAPAVNEFACCWPIPARYAGELKTKRTTNIWRTSFLLYEPTISISEIADLVENAIRERVEVEYEIKPEDVLQILDEI